MTNAEQWLADMEAKAKAATPGAWHIIEADDERFMSAVYVATTPEDATPGETPENVIAVTLLQSPRVACIADEKWDENATFIAAANPATVLRLVAMVRWLAAQRQELLSGYCPEDMRVGCLGNCIDCRHGQIAIKSAYAATEDHHDQN